MWRVVRQSFHQFSSVFSNFPERVRLRVTKEKKTKKTPVWIFWDIISSLHVWLMFQPAQSVSQSLAVSLQNHCEIKFRCFMRGFMKRLTDFRFCFFLSKTKCVNIIHCVCVISPFAYLFIGAQPVQMNHFHFLEKKRLNRVCVDTFNFFIPSLNCEEVFDCISLFNIYFHAEHKGNRWRDFC